MAPGLIKGLKPLQKGFLYNRAVNYRTLPVLNGMQHVHQFILSIQ